MTCNPIETGRPGIFRCTECGSQNPRPTINGKPWRGTCRVGQSKPAPPDLTPLLVCLVEFTHHPEILDNPQAYGRAVQQWAAGLIIYGPSGAEACRVESFEIRDNDEVAECLDICQENVCGKYRDGMCKPSCGPGMIVAVMARMATQDCPWRGQNKQGGGPRW